MTPAARVQAAIEVLETVLDNVPAERALTGWARRSRFAGSKDRAAVRDHVYDVLRRRNSCAAAGGGHHARALMLGALRGQGQAIKLIFTGDRHAPDPLSETERDMLAQPMPGPTVDLPDWLVPRLHPVFDDRFDALAALYRDRAPVFLRVNTRKARLEDVVTSLQKDGVETKRVAGVPCALEVVEGARRVGQTADYRDGLIELQAAASQAAVDRLPLKNGQRILDYCAGGGGKTLAMAGRVDAAFFAHDANPRRLRDLPTRAKRAGVDVKLLDTTEVAAKAPFDLVLCDVPCSGSGTWRRDPDAKWRFRPEDLERLRELQGNILGNVQEFTNCIAYATCSVLEEENEAQVRRFIERCPQWRLDQEQRWPLSFGDGFYLAVLTRE